MTDQRLLPDQVPSDSRQPRRKLIVDGVTGKGSTRSEVRTERLGISLMSAPRNPCDLVDRVMIQRAAATRIEHPVTTGDRTLSSVTAIMRQLGIRGPVAPAKGFRS